MIDPAHKETETILQAVEKQLTAEYAKATREVHGKLADYLRRFKIKDEKWREWVKDGKRTEQQYKAWRQAQIAAGKRWEALRDQLATDLLNVDEIARGLVTDSQIDIYALNHNFGIYEIEHGAGVETSFTLYNREAVERMVRENPDLLPPPGKKVSRDILAGRAERWNRQKIQSVMMQGILQGDSIPNLATRIATAVGDSNRKSAIRNARTMATGAQNAGRVDAYKRAASKGLKVRQTWMAIVDNRTRHEHRQLDGVTVDVGKSFVVDGYKLRFPGDPDGAPHLVYNCRCTLIGQVKGFETDIRNLDIRSDEKIKGMTYEQWKEAKAQSQPIDEQERKGKSIKRWYVNQYRRG